LLGDRSLGTVLLLGGIFGILAYLWLIFASPYDLLILKLTAVVAVASIFGILAWIGYTMVSTPPAPAAVEPQSSKSDTESKTSAKKKD